LLEELGANTILLWDDIHDIPSLEGTEPFRTTVVQLRETLEDDLTVLATARSEYQEKISGISRWESDRVWKSFKQIELSPLNREQVETLIRRVDHGNVLEKSTQRELSEIIVGIDPTPFYTISCIQRIASEGNSTLDEIDSLPETGLEIWETQYEQILTSNPEERRVLICSKLLYELNIPLEVEIIEFGCDKLFSLDRLELTSTLHRLSKKGWVDYEGADDRISIHRMQLAAIENVDWSYIREFSETIRQDLANHLNESEEVLSVINYRTALALRKRGTTEARELAMRHIEKCLSIDGGRVEVHTAYGMIKMKQGELDDARIHLQKAVDLRPREPAARYNLGVFLYKHGSTKEAINHLEEIDNVDDHSAEVLSTLASAYLNEDEPSKAAKILERAESEDPDLPHIYYRRSNMLYEYGAYSEAISISLVEEQGRYRNLLRAYSFAAEISERQRNVNMALSYCRQGLSLAEALLDGSLKSNLSREDETIVPEAEERRLRRQYIRLLRKFE
jgi:tetratricopeptide (TPR) repeat protein